MDRELVRKMMNRKLGRFLYSARVRSQSSVEEVAAAVGWSVERLMEIEKAPAEVPCRQLYRLISHYGPERAAEAQFVLFDTQISIREPRWPFIISVSFLEWSPFEIARGVVRLAFGFGLYQLLKEIIKAVVFRRIN